SFCRRKLGGFLIQKTELNRNRVLFSIPFLNLSWMGSVRPAWEGILRGGHCGFGVCPILAVWYGINSFAAPFASPICYRISRQPNRPKLRFSGVFRGFHKCAIHRKLSGASSGLRCFRVNRIFRGTEPLILRARSNEYAGR